MVRTHTRTHPHWNTNQTFKKKKKERNLAFFDSMDGPGGYYTKWDKSGGRKLYDLTHM